MSVIFTDTCTVSSADMNPHGIPIPHATPSIIPKVGKNHSQSIPSRVSLASLLIPIIYNANALHTRIHATASQHPLSPLPRQSEDPTLCQAPLLRKAPTRSKRGRRCCIRILVGSFRSSAVSPTGDRGAKRAHAGRNMLSAQAVGHRRCERAVDHMQDKLLAIVWTVKPAKTITALPWRAKRPHQSESLVPKSRRCVALRHEVWRVDRPELESSRAAGLRAHWVAHLQ